MIVWRKELITLLVMTGIMALCPLVLGGDQVMMRVLILTLVYATVAQAWDLIMGYAGVFTFGQVAFFGIGAYTSAILTGSHGVSPWLGLLCGGVVAAFIGFLTGLPCLRLKPSYVALLTFAIQMLASAFVLASVGLRIGTGGPDGLYGLPPLSIFGLTPNALELTPSFYIALGLFFVFMMIIYKVIFSRPGRAFTAVRDNDQLASSLGVSAYRYKLLVFVISAFVAGALGAFFASYTGAIGSTIFGVDMFLMLILMQVLGGMGMFPGTALAAFIILWANQQLLVIDKWRPVVFGVAIILVVLLLPHGILGTLRGRRGNRVLEETGALVRRVLRLPSRVSSEDAPASNQASSGSEDSA